MQRILLAAAVSLAVAGPATANVFVGDLVYCDHNANGVFDGGDQPLDGVEIGVVCTGADGQICAERFTETGELHESVNVFAFQDTCGGVATWNPYLEGPQSGRYLVEVLGNPDVDGCGGADPFICRVEVLGGVPESCNVLVTPRHEGLPLDNDDDGLLCTPGVDGPFPEGQILGSNGVDPAACVIDALVGKPNPSDAVHYTADAGNGQDNCALYSDFGYTPGGDCAIDVDKTCCVPPPPGPPAGDFDCKDAKPITSLSLIWNGPSGVDIDTEGGESFDGVVNGQELVIATAGLGNDVELDVSGAISGSSKFHVSCSDKAMNGPEDCGSAQGNGKNNEGGLLNLWAFEGMSGDETLDCTPADPGPQDGTACVPENGSTGDDCQGKVTEAVFEYTGSDCQASLPDKASCKGSTGGARISIEAKNSIKVQPKSGIKVGDLIRVTSGKASKKELKGSLKLKLHGHGKQELKIHTSCSKPLNVGMEFGGLKLVELTTTEGGTVVLDPKPVEFQDACEVPAGSAVEYQYTIRNPNAGPLDVSSVFDDKLMELLDGPLIVPGGESVTLFEQAVLSRTTKNIVVVSGDSGGTTCDEAMDMVTVTVNRPPPTDFVCKDAKPITSLSLIWNGPSGVDIETESGQTFDGVVNGQELLIAAADLGNDVELDVSGAISGSSKFHVSCSDKAMNGPEDCGSAQGNGKGDDGDLLNLWVFEGMAGNEAALDCTP